MPTYSYKCRKCENEFDKTVPMNERTEETKKPCSECGGEIYQKIGVTNFSYAGTAKSNRHSNDFNDKLKDMRKNLPKGKLPIDNAIH